MSAKNKDFALQSDVGEVRQIERVSYSSSAVKTPEQRGTPVSIISPISLTDSSTTACLRHGLELSTIAEDAENAEKNMTLWEGLRIYPRAIMWSLLISVTLIMEGYSTILIPNLNSMPAFQRDFGVPTSAGYEIPAAWQSAFVYTALAGQIVGLTITGLVAKKEGYKFMLQAALVAYTLSVFILFFATTKLALVLGQAAMGIPLGVFQCISGAYAVEVCPVKLRGYLTTYVSCRPGVEQSSRRDADTGAGASMDSGYSGNLSLRSCYVSWCPVRLTGPIACRLRYNGFFQFPSIS